MPQSSRRSLFGKIAQMGIAMMSMQNSSEVFRILLLRILVMPIVVAMIGGCMIPHHRGAVSETPPPVVNRVTQHFPSSLYRLAEGDILEFLYLTIPGATQTVYKLQIKDQIDIEFTFHPEMNRTVRVRPDGRISIPRKDDVSVVGMTADEVKRMLKRVYSDLLRDPDMTVSVREFNAKLDEIQKAVATAPNGQARLINVRPDGYISLPLVPELKAEGLTLPQLTKIVNQKYASIIPEMKVSVLLKEVVGNLIFVDGEVSRPGVFTSRGPVTVQHAIALAGGTRETAEPRTVLVISRGPDGKFMTRTTDLSKMTSRSDFLLKRNDLVYVPRSTIARADVWVDQNIRRLLMFTGWNLGISTDLGRSTVR